MRSSEGAPSWAVALPPPLRPCAYGVSEVTRCWHQLSLGAGESSMNPSATLYRRQNIGSEVETSTIEKQRKELQLLIGELKDRDKELNDMVAVHQRQLLSWEEDRQKVLTLEERCSKLEGELHKRTDIIKSLMKKVKTLESNQAECQTALQKTQQQLQEMAQKATHSTLLSEDLEDKDIIEAVNHISDCSGKFKLLEHALRDAKMAETCVVREKQDYKQKLKALRIEVNKLKEDLNEKTTENNEQREEIIRLKQEKSCLHDELIFTVEREKRKDELLDIAKSKQDRTNSELQNLRQIYVKQQSDLQFLNFNIESSQELIQIHGLKMEEPKALECSKDMCLSDLDNNYPKIDIKRERNQKSLVKDQTFEVMLAQHNGSDKSSCDACREKKLQVNTALGEKSVIALSSLFTKDLLDKQKSWSLGGKIQTEPENKVTLCKVHAKSPKCDGVGLPTEEKQLSETSVSLSDKTMCTCSRSVSAMKYNSSASELIGMQPSQCVGSLKSAEREEESAALPDRRTSANEKDDFSPTSKLQRLLAESRQMVTDLELSTLLPISCENLNRSKLEVSEEPDEKTTLVSH